MTLYLNSIETYYNWSIVRIGRLLKKITINTPTQIDLVSDLLYPLGDEAMILGDLLMLRDC